MLRLLLLIATASIITGCSSTPQYSAPYCYTDEHIVMQDNDTVSSTTHLECTDRPGRQAEIARAGIDSSCEEYWYTEIRKGRRHQVRGVRCEKLDGSWEVLNLNGTVR